jgi:ribonuclease HII
MPDKDARKKSTTGKSSAKAKAAGSILPKLLSFDKELAHFFAHAPQGQFFWPLKVTPLWTALEVKELPAIIGVDEVGRGCLAGPVVAAAVILPAIEENSEIARKLAKLNDSKLLTAEEREELAVVIQEISLYAIREGAVDEIDKFNILQASLRTMKRARQSLAAPHFSNPAPQTEAGSNHRLAKQADKAPPVVLVDGNKHIPQLKDRQVTVVGGDSKSASIAAASVIAKVYRDKLMAALSHLHPEYLWHQNKGYATTDHRQAIVTHGITSHHRQSFNTDFSEEFSD